VGSRVCLALHAGQRSCRQRQCHVTHGERHRRVLPRPLELQRLPLWRYTHGVSSACTSRYYACTDSPFANAHSSVAGTTAKSEWCRVMAYFVHKKGCGAGANVNVPGSGSRGTPAPSPMADVYIETTSATVRHATFQAMQPRMRASRIRVIGACIVHLLVFFAPLTMSPLCCLMRRRGLTVNLHAWRQEFSKPPWTTPVSMFGKHTRGPTRCRSPPRTRRTPSASAKAANTPRGTTTSSSAAASAMLHASACFAQHCSFA